MNTNPFRKSVYKTFKKSFIKNASQKNTSRKSVILAMAIAVVLLIAAVGSASALPACSAPGNTAISSSCELTQDYTVSTAGQYGYKIVVDNVIIDGKGHKITGTMPASCGGGEAAPCTCAGVIIYNNDSVVVKDMEITGFCTGIVVGDNDGDDFATNMEVTGCKIHDCGEPTGTTHGIHLVRANDCTFTKNEIYEIDGTGTDGGCGGGGNGIFGYGADYAHGNYGNVTCNYLHDNTKSGVFTKKRCQYWTFANNNASDNGETGIRPMCMRSNYCTIEYNIMTGNAHGGYTSQASYNTLRFNTITNNGQLGIKFLSDKFEPHGMYNKAYNNTICGHTVLDIHQSGDDDGTNKVDSNTCDNTSMGGCDWGCGGTLTTVYYDFDEDIYYSKDPVDCSCNNILGVGSCCNPGLFNGSAEAKASYEASCNCQWTAGDDPNDCNASITGAGAATFEKDLLEGWNLVSLPLIPSDKQVSSVLNSIDGQYDAVARYNEATHQFVTLSVSDEMDNGVGYFIHMTVNGAWSYQGTAYENINVGLSQGLNCIGWTNTSANLPGALNSIAGNYNYVARWNATSQSYEAYEPNAPPPFNDFTTMNRGEGYWIATKGSCTLTYP